MKLRTRSKSLLILLVGLLVFGCGGAPQESESTESAEEPMDGTEETTPAASTATVYNPNLASTDELLGLPHMTTESVEKLEGSRPFLEAKSFVSFIQGELTPEQTEEVLTQLFLPMNLNGPSEEDFLIVPGVGDKMAHEFEEYQPYASMAQFRREIGKYVDDEQVAKYEQYVFVPVNLNTASKDEILAIPGVGERMAHEFEEYQPYQSIEQFRREIGKYVDDDELRRLERYVTL